MGTEDDKETDGFSWWQEIEVKEEGGEEKRLKLGE